MRRKVIILRFGSVGSSDIKPNPKLIGGHSRWALQIAANVGVKIWMVYSIIKKYIADGYQVIQPPWKTGGVACPLN